MGEVLNEAGRKYLYALRTHPLRTKALTAGCITGCSQAAAQKIGGTKKLDYRRIALAFLYGLIYSGPFGHFFHKLMDYLFNRRQDGSTIVKKVALEQAFSGPWNNFLFMLYYGLILEGRPWSSVKSKIRTDYPSVQWSSWKVWPIIGLINYRYVPTEFRVLFHGVAAAFWGVFLSLKARSAIKAA